MSTNPTNYSIGTINDAGSTDIAYVHVALGQGTVYKVAPNGVQDIESNDKYIDDLINFANGQPDTKVFNYITSNGHAQQAHLKNFGDEVTEQIRFNGPIVLKSGTEPGIPATNLTLFATTNTASSGNPIDSIKFKFQIQELKIESNNTINDGVLAVLCSVHPRSETANVNNVIASTVTEVRAAIEVPTTFDVEVNIPVASQSINGYKVTVIKTTRDSNNAINFSEVQLLGFDEIQNEKFAYPGIAQIGYAFRATAFREEGTPNFSTAVKGLICRVPSNYNQPILEDGQIDWRQLECNSYSTSGYFMSDTGNTSAQTSATPSIYKGVWDGAFKYEWTENPAWVTYELLTNTIFGLGLADYYIDKFSFYQAAMYYDAVDLVTGKWVGVPAIADGTWRHKPHGQYTAIRDILVGEPEGTIIKERRYTTSISINQQAKTIDHINKILGACSTVLIPSDKIYLHVDRPDRYPVHIFNETNIIDGTFMTKGVREEELINAVDVVYTNFGNHYKPETITVDDAKLITSTGGIRKPIQVNLEPVSRHSEAMRFAQKLLAKSKYKRRRYSFSVFEEARDLNIGEVVSLSYRTAGTKYGYGGQIKTNSAIAANTAIYLEHYTSPAINTAVITGNVYPLALRVYKRNTGRIDTFLVSNSNYALVTPDSSLSGVAEISLSAISKLNKSTMTFSSISAFAANDIPVAGDVWSLGEYNTSDRYRSTMDKLLEIEDIQDNGGNLYTISASEYVSNVYSDSESVIGYTPVSYKTIVNPLLQPPSPLIEVRVVPVPSPTEHEIIYDILMGSDSNRNDFPLMVSTDIEVYSTPYYSDILSIGGIDIPDEGGGGGGDSGFALANTWTFTSVGTLYGGYYGHLGTHTKLTSNLADAVYNTTASVWGTQSAANNSLTANFGAQVLVANVKIVPIPAAFGGWGAQYTNNVLIQVSNDAVSWTTTNVTSGHAEGTVTRYYVNQVAKYVKFVRQESDYLAAGDLYFD